MADETKTHVLIIDEDLMPAAYYKSSLERRGFHVVQKFGPNTAVEFVQKHGDDLAAILLDIMMPTDQRYSLEETEKGMKTGVFLHEELREMLPDVPILVISNLDDRRVLGEFHEDERLKVRQKMDLPPLELADLVCSMIGRG